MSEINYYGTDADYIHLKWGDVRKAYNFTPEFRKKHPNFCKEYEKYWLGEEGRFETPLQVVQYIDTYNIPVHLYFNFTDTPVQDMAEVYAYFIREYTGKTSYNEDGTLRENWREGLDGEEREDKDYQVRRAP